MACSTVDKQGCLVDSSPSPIIPKLGSEILSTEIPMLPCSFTELSKCCLI